MWIISIPKAIPIAIAIIGLELFVQFSRMNGQSLAFLVLFFLLTPALRGGDSENKDLVACWHQNHSPVGIEDLIGGPHLPALHVK